MQYNKDIDKILLHFKHILMGFVDGSVAVFFSKCSMQYSNCSVTNEMEKSSLAKYLKKARLIVSLPFLRYEVTLDDLIDSKDVDERIERISIIKNDLEETIVAVEQLQAEAFKSKNEANKLKETISLLKQDKSTAEAMVKLPEESFSRILSRASSKGRVRGIIEGIIIGFITGILSSLLVWYLTK